MERAVGGNCAGGGGGVRGGGKRRVGGVLCKEIRGTFQFAFGVVLWRGGICGIRAGDARVGVPGGGAVHCVVGRDGASDAIVDVATGGAVVAGEIAGSDQFAAGVDGDGGAAAVHAGVCGGDCAGENGAFAGSAVSAGDGVVGGEFGAGGGGDAGEGEEADSR